MTPYRQGNRAGTNRKAAPKKVPADKYTVDSYRRAIHRACKVAGVPQWHPHQLRHNHLTGVRREHGLEAARVMADHRSAIVTDAVYAERDMSVAVRTAEAMG